MKYLVGGSTGMLKEVDTTLPSIKLLTPMEEQDLDAQVRCISWCGGKEGDEPTELVIGRADGTVEVYEHPSMNKISSFKMDSGCVHIWVFLPTVAADCIYFMYRIPFKGIEEQPRIETLSKGKMTSKYICCIFENGTCALIDYDEMLRSTAKRYKSNTVEVKFVPPDEDQHSMIAAPGLVSAYKFKGPISAAVHHTYNANMVTMAGPNVPPIIFDLFSEQILWSGKMPNPTYLGLQTPLEVKSICFLEGMGPQHIAVSTSDSYIYFYNATLKRKPIYDLNVCDRRSRGFSMKQLNLQHIRDYSAERKKEIRQSVNEFYSSDARCVTKLVHVPEKQNLPTIAFYSACELIACDNVGSIYHYRIYTGSSLEQYILRKIQAYRKDKRCGVTDADMEEFFLGARQRVGSASANDRPMHYVAHVRNNYLSELLGTYSIHNGAVTDMECTREYLVTTGLDRYTNVYSVRHRKLLSHMYCNQKQTALLLFPGQYFMSFKFSTFKSIDTFPPAPIKETKEELRMLASDDSIVHSSDNSQDTESEAEKDNSVVPDYSDASLDYDSD